MARSVLGPPSGDKALLIQYAKNVGAKRMPDVLLFLDELYNQSLIDAFMVAIQSIHETDGWTSNYWVDNLNPAGLGILYAGQASRTWKNGTDAARAMLIHHAAYTGLTLPTSWQSWLLLDTRYQIVLDEGLSGSVKVWSDYGNGKWAVDPDYYQGILTREQAVRSLTLNNQHTGGTMTTPNIIDKWLHVTQDGYQGVERRYKGRFGMQPEIIVIHIQEGTNLGSWQHFHSVSASSTVLIGKNGDIWRLVPESDAPWTNGDVMSPTAVGWNIMNTYGADPNVYTLSIETEGFTGEWPKPQAQLDSVLWQVRQWMKTYNIPLERVIRHADVNQVTRPNCPGQAYYNYLITELKKDQPTTPTYGKAEPITINGKAWDGKKDVTVNNVTFYADSKKVTAAKEANVRTFATTTSALTRQPLNKGEVFSVLGWTIGEKVNGDDRWWITKYFSRIPVDATIEKPTDRDVATPLPDAPAGTVIYKGVVYYPATLDDEHPLTIVRSANLRQSASTTSKVVGTVKKGDTIKVAYWCFGDEVHDERIWWVLDGKDAIKKSARIWVAATSGRPE